MLNRTEILRELLEIRKTIYKKELILKNKPSLEDKKVKKDIDRLIYQIIGDFISSEDKEQLDKILLKTACEEITVDIALIAIKEIVSSYYNKSNKSSHKKENNKYKYSNYKEKKNRNKHKSFYQEGYR